MGFLPKPNTSFVNNPKFELCKSRIVFKFSLLGWVVQKPVNFNPGLS